MLPLLFAFALLPSQKATYRADLLYTFPIGSPAIGTSYVGGIEQLADDAVGGFYCEYTGVHGETVLGKAFVLADGKRYWLPTGGHEYSHVYGAGGNVLVGDVQKSGMEHPAQWSADPKLGWGSAKLTILSDKSGWASSVAPDGTIWMRLGKDLVPNRGPRPSVQIDRFDLVGVDGSGRLFGNRYQSLGEGMRRDQQDPIVYQNGRWEPLPVGEKFSASLIAVNRRGVAIGSSGQKPAIWRAGKLSLLPSLGRWSFPVALNSRDDCVGYIADQQSTRAAIWRDGKLTDLSGFLPQGSSEARSINDSGEIVVVLKVENEFNVYRLEPR